MQSRESLAESNFIEIYTFNNRKKVSKTEFSIRTGQEELRKQAQQCS